MTRLVVGTNVLTDELVALHGTQVELVQIVRFGRTLHDALVLVLVAFAFIQKLLPVRFDLPILCLFGQNELGLVTERLLDKLVVVERVFEVIVFLLDVLHDHRINVLGLNVLLNGRER